MKRGSCCLGLHLALLQLLSVRSACTTNTLKVHNAYELINVSNIVNAQTSTSITVFLEADIDFTNVTDNFVPIGKEYNFTGVFDGKGHIISGLKLNSSYESIGLFGYAKDATIKNVIIDESCSIESHAKGTLIYTGSVIGKCSGSNQGCRVESIVNMGRVVSHENKGNSYIGGIAGFVSENNGHLINCVNYGDVMLLNGNSGRVGGIVGHSNSFNIQNCLNYGRIRLNKNNGGSVGGIAGSNGGVIENCISVGEISLNEGTIGAIVGDAQSGSSIIHCFWTDNVKYNNTYGQRGKETYNEENATIVVLNATSVDKLNQYASDRNWNSWILNLDNRSFSFNFNNNEQSLMLNFQLAPLLRLSGDDNHTFHGWFTDNIFTKNFTGSPNETALYSSYGVLHTLTFVGKGGNVTVNSTQAEGSMTAFPDKSFYIMAGHTFNGWNPDNTTVPDDDATLTALYIRNNYTVSFVFGNGTNATYAFGYNDRIVYPNVSRRRGYTFSGWSSNISFMGCSNITIKALWEESSEYVEIVFGKVGITKEKVEEIITEYTQDEFVIKKFDPDEDNGETKVIIKFQDKTSAENFVENIKETYDPTTGISIKKVGYIPSGIMSLSPTNFHFMDLILYTF